MKSLIGTILFGLLGFGVAFGVFQWLSGELDQEKFARKLQEARVQVVLESASMAAAPDEKRKQDRTLLMAAHARRLASIYKAHPKQKIKDKYIVNAKQKAKEGKRKKNKVAAVEKRYNWLKGVWEKTVKTGNYDTLLSGYQQGVRVDILDISPIENDKGKKVLRMNILVWGAAKDQLVFGDYLLSFRQLGDEEEQKKKKKNGLDADLSKVEWAGSPLIYHPEGGNPSPAKYIEGWPPSLGVGYWEGLPLLPGDVEKVDLEMRFAVKTTGGTTLPIEFKWKDIPVQSSWSLVDGAEFKHDVTDVIEE
ncbi:MAG: hypothetical protein GY822_20295 [Deltaproteobacteria bacterium]|nr:hypothetical protein [Deltaproteobacteria bacterium]